MDFVVCVEFTIKHECSSGFLMLILENAKTSMLVEEGCKQFDVCVEQDNPAKIFLYEIYSSNEAFDVHLNSEHFLHFNSKTADMVTDKVIRTYVRKS